MDMQQGSDQFVYTCNNCRLHVETHYHCRECDDFDLCVNCYQSVGHCHPMDRLRVELDIDEAQPQVPQNPVEARKQSIQKCIQYLPHACQCKDIQCKLPGCFMIKWILKHAMDCKLHQSGNCTLCKQFFILCYTHAKSCNEQSCPVPICARIKVNLQEQWLQKTLADQEIKIHSVESSSYDWKHGGITMEVPSGCLPEGVAECTLKVAASLGTDISLPEDTTLVSRVYHIITPPNVKRFKKPVTIHIEHCAGLKPGKEDKLSFVVAKEGETKFEFLPGGHFSSAYPYGSIAIHSFSFLAIVSDMLYGSTYCGCVFYTKAEPDGSHEVHIVVTRKPSLDLQEFSKLYRVPMHYKKTFKFTSPENKIVLELPVNSPDGWKLTPIVLELKKDEVDKFARGFPERFQFHVRKASPDAEPKDYIVKILKTQVETSFRLLNPPPTALSPVNYDPPPTALSPVNNEDANFNSYLRWGFISLGVPILGILIWPSLWESVLPDRVKWLLQTKCRSRFAFALGVMAVLYCVYSFIQAGRIGAIIPLIQALQPIVNAVLQRRL